MNIKECDLTLGSRASEVFVIDVPSGCIFTLYGGSGDPDVYRFVHSSKSRIQIADFNLETDKIDLSLFTELRSWRDVNMTAGSVLIHLPENMVVILLNTSLSDISPRNFVFAEDATGVSNDNDSLFSTANVATVVAFCFVSMILFCLVISSASSWNKSPSHKMENAVYGETNSQSSRTKQRIESELSICHSRLGPIEESSRFICDLEANKNQCSSSSDDGDSELNAMLEAISNDSESSSNFRDDALDAMLELASVSHNSDSEDVSSHSNYSISSYSSSSS